MKARVIAYVLLGVYALISLYPFAWMVSGAFKDRKEVLEGGNLIPDRPTLDTFATTWGELDFLPYFVNSLLVTVATVIGVLVVYSLASYAFAVLKFPGSKLIYAGFVSLLFVPGITVLLPVVILQQELQLLGTQLGLVLPFVNGTAPLAILLLTNAFRSVPSELRESARCDGASELRTFLSIYLPVSRPALIAIALLTAVPTWNEYVLSRVSLNDAAVFTLPLGLQSLTSTTSPQYNVIMAASLIIVLPVIVLFVLLQRYFVNGLVGAVKGVKVLVTGAGGALGGLVAEQLSAGGHSVRAHDKKTISGSVGDLADLTHVQHVVAGVDAVVHCAAIPSPVDHPDDEIFRNNVQSTYNVLDTAGRAGVGRIVYISSASALGLAWSQLDASPIEAPVTEDHPFVGDDVYGLSKQVGETIAAAASRRWRTTIVSLRFPFIGTGERLEHHLKPIHDDPGVDRGGLWAWLDMRDAVRAVEAALTVPLDGHHLLNVVAPDTTALVSTAELLGTYHPTAVITRPFGEFESVYSGQRCRRVLGFEPIYGWRGVVR